MFKKAANYIQGDVLLTVESAYPERIMNLCSAHAIPFWDVRWQSQIQFTFHTTRWGERRLRAVSGQTDVQIRRLRERGAPTLLLRIHKRYVLLGALGVFLLLLLGSNLFIWDFEVTGNDTVPTEEILRSLERQGITVGSMSSAIDQEDLRNHMLLELPDVSWLAVNVRGCVAHIQVVERLRPPPIVQENEKTNVVAARDGLVTKVEALDGQANVMAGNTVIKGQILISGVSDGGAGGMRLMHSMGNVWARTWHEYSTLVPLQTTEKGTPSSTRTRLALDLGKTRIKFYGKGSVTEPDCDKITQYQAWILPGGFRLPVTLVVERQIQRDVYTSERSAELARQEGEALLMEQLEAALDEDGSIVDTRFASARQGDYLLVTLKAECLEQIGVSVPLNGG